MNDISAVEITKNLGSKSYDKKLHEVSKQFAGVFMSQMMKMMRGDAPEGGVVKQNTGERMFRELADDEMASNAAMSNNYGIADMIYKALSARNTVNIQNAETQLSSAQREAQNAYVGK